MLSAPATMRILEVSSYPPPPSGWSVRIQFLKQRLESEGHDCRVLNIGESRTIPSPDYECVFGPADYVAKLWRFSREGYRVHAHVNGHSPKGLMLAIVALSVNRVWGRHPVLTFHGGADQTYFPRARTPFWMVPGYTALIALSTRIVCNSEAVKAGLVGYGASPDTIEPIPAFSLEYLAFRPAALPEAAAAFVASWPELVFTYIRLRAVFFPDVLLDAFATVARARPSVGFFICGVGEHAEGEAAARFWSRVEGEALLGRVFVVPELDRQVFLTVLSQSRACVRSPTTDGVSASVLEALALRVPVVAAENGHRPRGVVTYPADDPRALAATLTAVLDDHDRIARELPNVSAEDTLTREVALLTSCVVNA